MLPRPGPPYLPSPRPLLLSPRLPRLPCALRLRPAPRPALRPAPRPARVRLLPTPWQAARASQPSQLPRSRDPTRRWVCRPSHPLAASGSLGRHPCPRRARGGCQRSPDLTWPRSCLLRLRAAPPAARHDKARGADRLGQRLELRRMGRPHARRLGGRRRRGRRRCARRSENVYWEVALNNGVYRPTAEIAKEIAVCPIHGRAMWSADRVWRF